MSARLLRLAAAALLVIGPAAAVDSDPSFEIDVVFPRNETYTLTDVLPIAVAIQNMTALRSLGDDYEFIWTIMPYGHGVTPGGISYDQGEFPHPDEDEIGEDDNHVFVAYTNASEWIKRKKFGEQYALKFYVFWPGYEKRCGREEHSSVAGHIMFSVEAPWETTHREMWPEDGPKVYKPQVKDVPKCPEFGAVVEIRAEAGNSSCPSVVDEETGREKDPCGMVVDRDYARGIDKVVSSLAAEDAASATALYGPEETEDLDNAAGVVGVSGGVMAASCVLGWLAIAW